MRITKTTALTAAIVRIMGSIGSITGLPFPEVEVVFVETEVLVVVVSGAVYSTTFNGFPK